jgi:predicted enzyme related to lactoylglutathione lyase
MKIKEIAFVAYTVSNLTAGRKFYGEVLGLTETNVWADPAGVKGFIEYDIGACTLSIGNGAPNFASGPNGAIASLEVEDFKEAIADLQKHKVKFVSEPVETPGCHLATIEDPDGNRILIHKRK